MNPARIGKVARFFGRALREELRWRKDHPEEWAEELEDRARRRFRRDREGLARLAWSRAVRVRDRNDLEPTPLGIDGKLADDDTSPLDVT